MTEQTGEQILDLLHTWTRSLVPDLAAFIEGLADLEPEIRPLIAEHIRDYDEMLPTLFMGDIARWVISVTHDSPDPATRLQPFFDRLEQGWGDGQNPVSDLIATSFVENVYDDPDVVTLLGPNLARYYRLYTRQDKIREDEKRPMPEVMKQILKKLGRR
ncbi:hypothetical protein OHA40_30595 [Nocardia sp. NBC_00508]|uniref:DUF7674 family protein n=1 Tax=Nocardia sp. NBC_00508 TaxID=2975992 RepID=UPI002E7FFF05|nr:hypothetical protein [Nocardia sp. NBC_00508]WUD65893.1 hypothetical protein OHA40_30595 [Nocardia sp. NBC_00508]